VLKFLSRTFQVADSVIDALISKHCGNCAICKGARTVITKTGREKCECLKAYNREYALYAANIPKEFHTLTGKDLNPAWVETNKSTFRRMKQYSGRIPKAVDEGFGLYLGGTSGAGKTFMAALLLKQAIRTGYTGYFILLRDLVSAAMNALRDPEVQLDVDDLVTGVDFLVLDDVDKVTAAKEQELVNTVITALLKKRKYSGKPLIVTANCRADELHKRLGTDLANTIISGLSEMYFQGDAHLNKVKALEDEFFNG